MYILKCQSCSMGMSKILIPILARAITGQFPSNSSSNSNNSCIGSNSSCSSSSSLPDKCTIVALRSAGRNYHHGTPLLAEKPRKVEFPHCWWWRLLLLDSSCHSWTHILTYMSFRLKTKLVHYKSYTIRDQNINSLKTDITTKENI